MEKTVCKKCQREFGYEIWGDIYPGGKDKEYIDCPYCGETAFTRMTSGFVKTFELDVNGEPIR